MRIYSWRPRVCGLENSNGWGAHLASEPHTSNVTRAVREQPDGALKCASPPHSALHAPLKGSEESDASLSSHLAHHANTWLGSSGEALPTCRLLLHIQNLAPMQTSPCHTGPTWANKIMAREHTVPLGFYYVSSTATEIYTACHLQPSLFSFKQTGMSGHRNVTFQNINLHFYGEIKQ